nr:hypothetical protein [Candidatus Protofrankia californiensis]
MIMTPGLRRAALTAHVVSSVGWIGAVGGFLALAVAGLTSTDAETVRACYLEMEVIAWFVVVPTAAAAVVTGVVQSLGTAWGLFRHYWVLAKLLVTVLAAVVLVMQLGPISFLADVATTATLSAADLRQARISLLVHAAGGELVLLVPMVLSVYKPRGRTRYGQRRQHSPRAASVRSTGDFHHLLSISAPALRPPALPSIPISPRGIGTCSGSERVPTWSLAGRSRSCLHRRTTVGRRPRFWRSPGCGGRRRRHAWRPCWAGVQGWSR